MKSYIYEGKIIGLREPNIVSDIDNGEWHKWFNDLEITRYLEHGVFPITMEAQRHYISQSLEKNDMVLFCIDRLDDNKHVGVISLKNIDLLNRRCEIGIVIGRKIQPGGALEAMSLMSQHAFFRLNLEKIYAGQHQELWKWINTLMLIGFKLEGYREHMGIRNSQSYSVALTGITKEDYETLLIKRNGCIFDKLHPGEFIKRRSKINHVENIKSLLNQYHIDNTF